MKMNHTELNLKWELLLIPLLFLFPALESQAVSIYGKAVEAEQSDLAAENIESVSVDSSRVVEIRSTGSDLSYDVTEIKAKAGEELTIRYVNASDMPHNIVLVKEEGDINLVGIAALQAYENDYIPENEMDRIIAHTELARPGDTVEFTFTVPPPGTYPYICSYPGHFTSMQGRLISSE
ncbi:MAG: plastocyanin/azurin family copper-binding protein [Balneolaceae bacterium]